MNNKHIEVGMDGEDVVCECLLDDNFIILARNVRFKCGELDFVAYKQGTVHFIEVKTASVKRETSVLSIKPEENLNFRKIIRLKRAIQLYMMQNKLSEDKTAWQFDLYTVVIHETTSNAIVCAYHDVIL